MYRKHFTAIASLLKCFPHPIIRYYVRPNLSDILKTTNRKFDYIRFREASEDPQVSYANTAPILVIEPKMGKIDQLRDIVVNMRKEKYAVWLLEETQGRLKVLVEYHHLYSLLRAIAEVAWYAEVHESWSVTFR